MIRAKLVSTHKKPNIVLKEMFIVISNYIDE